MLKDKSQLNYIFGVDIYALLAKHKIPVDEILYDNEDFVKSKLVNLLDFLKSNFPEYNLPGNDSQCWKFLDLFCGDGKFCAQLQQEKLLEWKVYGVDGNSRAIELSKQRFLDNFVSIVPEERLLLHTCPPLPYENNLFNIVYGSNILNNSDIARYPHNPFPQTFKLDELASEIHRVLVPNGLYLSVNKLFDLEIDILTKTNFNYLGTARRTDRNLNSVYIRVFQKMIS